MRLCCESCAGAARPPASIDRRSLGSVPLMGPWVAGAGAAGPGRALSCLTWHGVAALRLSLQSLCLMFFHRSCWQSWGPQTAPSEDSHLNSYRGFSLPIAACGKSSFFQACSPR